MGADFSPNTAKQRKNLDQSLRSEQSESQGVLMPNDAVDRYSRHSSKKYASYQPHHRSAGNQIEPTQRRLNRSERPDKSPSAWLPLLGCLCLAASAWLAPQGTLRRLDAISRSAQEQSNIKHRKPNGKIQPCPSFPEPPLRPALRPLPTHSISSDLHLAYPGPRFVPYSGRPARP